MVTAIISLVISIIVAFGVIYSEFIHDWLFKPKLEVTFSLEEPISRETSIEWPPEALETSR